MVIEKKLTLVLPDDMVKDNPEDVKEFVMKQVVRAIPDITDGFLCDITTRTGINVGVVDE